MFASTRFIFLQPSLTKHGNGGNSTLFVTLAGNHRFWLLAFIFFFSFAFLLTLLSSTPPGQTQLISSFAPPLSKPVSSKVDQRLFDALIHYAVQSTASGRMTDGDLRFIAGVLRRRAPCNLLVFGLGPETLLWRALNHGGRTVFLDENQHYIAHYEERHPGIEGYDVTYTTKVSDLNELLTEARAQIGGECRPVQNLLFSDCKIGINDLPNHVYDMAWDIILVDGPRGYSPESPGRISTIYTAAVLARYGGEGITDVLIHDYEREVEKICSMEFLCGENLANVEGQLAHFVIRGRGAARKDDFCFNRTATTEKAFGFLQRWSLVFSRLSVERVFAFTTERVGQSLHCVCQAIKGSLKTIFGFDLTPTKMFVLFVLH